MRGNVILNALSKRVPIIVVVTLCGALVVYSLDAPLWLPYGLALIVGGIAIVVMAAREGVNPRLKTNLAPTRAKAGLRTNLPGTGRLPDLTCSVSLVWSRSS